MLPVAFPRSLAPKYHTTSPLCLFASRPKPRWDWRRAPCAAQPHREGSGKLQVVFISTEISPWSKVGGLGDVLGSLPHALASSYITSHDLNLRGHQVMTVCPRYVPYDDTYDSGYLVPVEHPDEDLLKVSRLYMTHTKGVDHVFVDHPAFQGTGDKVVSDEDEDSMEEVVYPYWWGSESDFETCYSILCQVALAAPFMIWKENFSSAGGNDRALPDEGEGTDDREGLIFVANDWPCGILPIWMQNYRARADQVKRISCKEKDRHGSLKHSNSSCPDSRLDQDDIDNKELPDENSTVPAFVSTVIDISESLHGSLEEETILDRELDMQEKRNGTAKAKAQKTSPTRVKECQEDEKENIENVFVSQLPQMEPQEVAIQQKEVFPKSILAQINIREREALEADSQPSVAEPQLWDFQSWVGKRLANSKIAFAIHNMAYQGRSFLESLGKVGFPGALGRKSAQKSFQNANWLKVGLTWSDAVMTVSPGYALELMRGGWETFGLWDSIRKSGVRGIRNGVDVNVWDPQKDKFLPKNVRYGINEVERGKQLAKTALQEKLGLDVSPSIPLFGFIGRLDHQKGVDVVLTAAPSLLSGPSLPKPLKLEDGPEDILVKEQAGLLQLAMLGSGDQWLEEGIKSLQYSFPGYAVGMAEFSEEMAHQMLAGCDYLLVPSRFEPCGLVALCAVRYGCIPIVTPVGGLNDLVLTEKVGYSLRSSPNEVTLQLAVSDIIHCIKQATLEYGSAKFEAMRKKCMRVDVSWDSPATEWEEVLEGLRDDKF